MNILEILSAYAGFTSHSDGMVSSIHDRRIFVSPYYEPHITRQVVLSWYRILKNPFLRDEIDHISKRKFLKEINIHCQGRIFTPKVYISHDPVRLAQSMFFFCEAERNGSTLSYLLQNGIHVSCPLCLIRECRHGFVTRSILFLEKLPETAVDFKSYLPETLPFKSQSFRTEFFTQAGRAVAQVHRTGVYTEDTDQNLMVEKQGNSWIFYFLDFDNFYPWRVPTLRRTIHAIAHMLDTGKDGHYTCNSLETEAFVDAYLAVRDKPKWREPIMNHLKKHRSHIFSNPTCPVKVSKEN
jgi:3-deoxy-D-manno-octulosonic acid kinase